MSYRIKLLLGLLSLVALSCGLLLWLSLRHANSTVFELIREKVYATAVSSALHLDGDLVSSLQNSEQDGSPDYVKISDDLKQLKKDNQFGELPIRFVYIFRPTDDGNWEYVVDAEPEGEDKSYLGDLVEFESESQKPVVGTPSVDDAFATDSFGTWLSAFAPIKNREGTAVAMLGVDVDARRVTARLNQLKMGGFFAMGIALAVAAVLSFWLSKRVTEPLRELQFAVEKIGKGDLSTRAPTNYEDEFGALGFAINEMAAGLEERETLKGALVHYVRSQAADNKLWDDNEDSSEEEADKSGLETRRITVLIAELQGFSSLAEKMGTEKVFALLNDYFSTMIDIVLRNRGSLEKSTNDSVVAVFGSAAPDSHQERHAVEAAITMQHALERILHEWRIDAASLVKLQIGIHTGEVETRSAGGSQELDSRTVAEINRIAEEVKNAGTTGENTLLLSAKTAEMIQPVFPMSKLENPVEAEPVFQVTMPKPSLA